MAECVHVAENEIAIQWEERGALMVVGRDGSVAESFTPPFDSEPLFLSDADWDAVEDQVLQRVRNVARARGLSEKTIAAITATGRETP